MSVLHRCIYGALCCLFSLALATPAHGQALDSTPRITRGTCPAPHCNLGWWQSAVAIPVFATPGAPRPAFSLKPRSPFEAVGGETHSIPGVAVLLGKLEVADERTTRTLRRGDTIRTLANLGEGRVSVEAGGRTWVAVLDERDAARFQAVRPKRETWWVEVKAPDGRRGWIDGGAPGIAGATFDETMASLSRTPLDGGVLATLTGPAAAIAQQRASSTLAPFEAEVEGARAGEGVAWWRADTLRMLQLRYRTMLNAAGTTDPAHSGLPANAVVCCGDIVYQRLVVLTRREPEYIATITMPEKGERHFVEGFFQRGRLVRLLRDARSVAIGYQDSVMARAWYSGARALVQEVATNAPAAGSVAGARAGARNGGPAPAASRATLLRQRLVPLAIIVVLLGLAAVLAWQWRRRRTHNRPRVGPDALAAALAAVDQPEEEEEGWVCPDCHADVLVNVESCWLCGRPRPSEQAAPRAPAVLICGCGEPNAPGAQSCIRCGKAFRVRLF